MQQREIVNKFDRVQPPGTLITITLLHTDNRAANAVLGNTNQSISFHFSDKDHHFSLNNLPKQFDIISQRDMTFTSNWTSVKVFDLKSLSVV